MSMDQTSTRRIVVNADDYGYTTGVSEGIRQAFLAGTLSSTTAMMNIPGAEEAVRLAQREIPEMAIGAHLVLTFGRPVSAPGDVPSLVRPDGSFHSLGEFTENLDRIDPVDAIREWSAQIRKLSDLGVTVDHIDSHHHSSYLHPRLAQAMLEVARLFDLPVRVPPDPPESHPSAPALFAAATDVRTLHRFIGDLMKGSSPAKFISLVEPLPPGEIAELMVHPAILDDALLATSSYATPRAAELQTLCDPSVRRFLATAGVALTTFGLDAR